MNQSAYAINLKNQRSNESTKKPLVDAEQVNLRASVEASLQNYFDQLDGQSASNVYSMVLQEIEAPLFTMIMRYTRDNQTKAAQVLGINRGTLRKKLKQYGLL